MCIVCVEELSAGLTALTVLFPFLKSRIIQWKQRRKYKQMRRRTMLGKWA